MRPFPALVPSLAFVRVGLAKLLREGPRVRMRGTAVQARNRGPGAQTGLPRSQGPQPAQPPALGHLLLALHPFYCRVLPACAALAPASLTAPPHPKVLDQDTDAIAVHVVRVLTCIMSGSPSAKVRALLSACSRGVGWELDGPHGPRTGLVGGC